MKMTGRRPVIRGSRLSVSFHERQTTCIRHNGRALKRSRPMASLSGGKTPIFAFLVLLSAMVILEAGVGHAFVPSRSDLFSSVHVSHRLGVSSIGRTPPSDSMKLNDEERLYFEDAGGRGGRVNGDDSLLPELTFEVDDEESSSGLDDDDDDGKFSAPVCRVVATSDGKLPTSRSSLPPALFEEPFVLKNLDTIYHAMAHDETRRLKYMRSREGKYEYDAEEEENLVSVARMSLEDAGFELLSRRDLDLCEALNAGYLLRLSILPDVSELDPSIAREFYPEHFDDRGKALGNETFLFGGRVLVYWRGYSEEVSEGRMILPKIDYLQASLVQRSAATLKAQLNRFERWLSNEFARTSRLTRHAIRNATDNFVKSLPPGRVSDVLMAQLNGTYFDELSALDSLKLSKTGSLFFQLARYGGSKIRFVGSPNPTDALNPFVICEEEYCPPSINAHDRYFERLDAERLNRDVDRDMYDCMRRGLRCPYDDVNKPVGNKSSPMTLLKRVSISSLVDLFSSEGRQGLVKTIFSKSVLVEPTYEEVVVIWRSKPKQRLKRPVVKLPRWIYDVADMFDFEGLPPMPKPVKPKNPSPLEIRNFCGVPMANIPAVLPKTKLIFRPADAFVFDFVTVLSFLLVAGSIRFDSPRLDLIALVSVSLWIVRTVFRYSNKLARYDLLVKKFLTSKISHRNMGALKYIATEAGSQRAVRATLVHQWLRSLTSKGTPMNRSTLIASGEDAVNAMVGVYNRLPVDIDAALNDLEDLGLVSAADDGEITVVGGSAGIRSVLRKAWGDIFEGTLSLKAMVGRRRRS